MRAFAWLRWRTLVNSLERRGNRDALERTSAAVDQLAPVLLLLVMVPSALTLAGLGAYAGWSLARGEPPAAPLHTLRSLLLAGCALAVAGPLLLPRGQRTDITRLLLLPLSRHVLYAVHAASSLADPWVLLPASALVAMPLAMAAGGAAGLAAQTAAAGLMLLLILLGLGLVASGVIQLAVRDRRRGELITLVLVVVLPVLALLPAARGSDARRPARERQGTTAAAWWTSAQRAAGAVIPSEVYINVAQAASRGERVAVAAQAAGLAVAAVLLHALALALFTAMLASPGRIEARGATRAGSGAIWHIPGLAPGSSAIAVSQVRLGLRTARGRSTILSPVVLFVVLAVVIVRGGDVMEIGPLRLSGGVGLAAFTSFVALLSLLPLAMNQFAVDRAGLARALMAPLDTTSILVGKAAGNALIATIPAALCVIAAFLLYPGGRFALWLSIPPALIATYLWTAPAAAALSALFPRVVDLGSIGNRSSAHGAAGLLGTIVFACAGGSCLLLALVATRLLRRPEMAPVLLAGWAALAAAAATLLFRVAARLFDRRRENLCLLK